MNPRRLIVNREIYWYAGCGQVCEGEEKRDDLDGTGERDRAGTGNGRFRINHHPEEHDDRVFALGACLHLLTTQGEPEWMQMGDGGGCFFEGFLGSETFVPLPSPSGENS
ncbi:MAG: hypothetical protein U0903_18170 [Planctomycetales bacterium]